MQTAIAPRTQQQLLARLAGAYAGPETVPSSAVGGPAGTSSGRIRANMGLGGRYLVMDYQQEQRGSISRLAHAVFGVDPATGGFTMHWFDDQHEGPGSPATGVWHDEALVLEQAGPGGWSRYTFGAPMADGDTLTMRLETSSDGGTWTSAILGTYHRADWDRRTR